jgi:serine/threonine protein kinase/tetratricopeptide (TPR) repeat protein
VTSTGTQVPGGSELADRLAEDLSRRWHAGERVAVEDYLRVHPGLRDRPEAVVELIYEELCLRQEFGVGAEVSDVMRRFPDLRERLRVVIECHRFLEAASDTPSFPAAGEEFAGFHLLTELGRGAQGRVFLATQPDLADRPVVLKLSPRTGEEHLSLARLQHTHIVPLYSVTDDAEHNLRTLCMPYFGGATLAQILEMLADRPVTKRAGADFVAALEKVQLAAPVAVPVEGPACQFLRQATYARALCWMAACLADALQYTRERGLVHLDLKPSNVLLAADGQPMLLDLHLARGAIAAGEPAPPWLGGTPAYMAPEHRQALSAVREGRRVDTAVDGRADVYSLGMLLGEALCGDLPPVAGRRVPWLRRRNPQLTSGLADIVAKCLVEDPARRYPDAAALATDLRCHISDLPLRGVANRSPLERWRKWRRRRPSRLAQVTLALTAVVGSVLGLAYLGQQLRQARTALVEGQEHFRRGDFRPARDAWQRGLAMMEYLPLQAGLADEFHGHLRLLDRAETARGLHQFVESIRVLYGADGQSTADLRAVEARCRAFWEKRELIAQRLGTDESSAQGDQVRTDLLELVILWCDLRTRLAPATERNEIHREALDDFDKAEALFGRSCVLDCERRIREIALSLARPRPATSLPPRTAWEHCAVGRALFRSGKLDEAGTLFEHAVELEPRSVWGHFYQGACAYRRASYEEAALAFTACTVLAPEQAWCFYNRALAFDAAGKLDRALAEYSRALEIDPALAPAALNRGMIHYRTGRYAEALEDLARALDSGSPAASVCYARALVYLARGERIAALDHLDKALKLDPQHIQARDLARQLHKP